MPKGVYAAASAMFVESRALESVARNLANVQTPGYRQEIPLRQGFAQVLEAEGRVAAGRDTIARDRGAGVVHDQRAHRFTQGILEPTGHPYDVALTGPGFLTVRDADGVDHLTRGGHFDRDAQGRLRNTAGLQLVGQGGPITIPGDANEIIIGDDGTISAGTAGGGPPAPVDRIRVVEVDDPRRMTAVNGTLFRPDGQTVRDADAGTLVHQGRLEKANFEPVAVMVEMIELQRRHDAAQKALTTQANLGGELGEIVRM